MRLFVLGLGVLGFSGAFEKVGRPQRDAVLPRLIEHVLLLTRGHEARVLPILDRRRWPTDLPGHRADAAEFLDDAIDIRHGVRSMYGSSAHCQRIFRMDCHCGKPAQIAMAKASPVALKLKRLRERTGLSVREMAAKLDYESASSYAYYENEFKKSFLPLDLVQKLAPIAESYGIERSEVMALAGINGVGKKSQTEDKSKAGENTDDAIPD